jgi:hypothetical protein
VWEGGLGDAPELAGWRGPGDAVPEGVTLRAGLDTRSPYRPPKRLVHLSAESGNDRV